MTAKQNEALRSYQRAILAHRRRLDRLLDQRSTLALKRYFDRAQDKLEVQLARMAKDVHKDPLTPLQVQQLLLVVRDAQAVIARRLHLMYVPVMEEAQTEGLEQTAETIEEQERRAFGLTLTLSITDAAVASMIKAARAPTLIEQNRRNYFAFGTRLTQEIEKSLAVSLAEEETPIEAIERMRETADEQWWQSERILQTDLSHAFNQAQADGIQETGRHMPGLYKRWCELVDDVTGQPLDDRVAPDSMVLHGQVVAISGRFVMPPDPTVHRSFWNKTYFCSPNRPNDRSQTMPWRQGWGAAPGWVWEGGQRVNL